MSSLIKDGQGRGYLAGVTKNNRLRTDAISNQIQHISSLEKQEAYQVWGTADLSSGTVVPLHLKNSSDTHVLVCTYIRHQVVDPSGGTDFPNVSNYFAICLNRTYASGGSSVTPTNVYVGSGNVSSVTAYGNNPTLSGTATEIDRWYTKSEGDMYSYNKDGAIIIPPSQTLEFRYVTDHSSGLVWARLSFFRIEI